MPTPGAAWITPAAPRLSPADIAASASALGVAPRVLQAVLTVESAGRGFDAAGRPVVLYEPHVMDRQLVRNRPALLAGARKAGLSYAVWGTRPYPPEGDARWTVIDRAMALDMECACRAVSWGLGQILGEGYTLLGYGSATALARDAMVSEARQLAQVVAFIGGKRLVAPLHAMAWQAFAEGYNGTGNAEAYAAKLAAAYAMPVPLAHPAAPIQGPQQLHARPAFEPAAQQSSPDDSAETAALNDASLAAARGDPHTNGDTPCS